VKDEDIDWLIYHLIAQQTATAPDSLAAASGLDPLTVTSSLKRLEKSFLIERMDTSMRVLSIGESLLKCQTKYDESFPYTFENGVIRVKKRE
jgi:Mn-dependent DtxR family transcriptional regulator